MNTPPEFSYLITPGSAENGLSLFGWYQKNGLAGIASGHRLAGRQAPLRLPNIDL